MTPHDIGVPYRPKLEPKFKSIVRPSWVERLLDRMPDRALIGGFAATVLCSAFLLLLIWITP